MSKTEYEEIVRQSNECYRKTIANKNSWLIVPNNQAEAAIKLVTALDAWSKDENVS